MTAHAELPRCKLCGDRHDRNARCKSPQSLRAGDIIGDKYRVEERLGHGGMGTVYGARHVVIDRRFAIKFLHPHLVERKDMLERFQREARLAGSLESEHIAAVTDYGTTETGAAYLVMEYLAGEDLGQMLTREGVLPVPRALELVIQACYGLELAHAKSIVHRDLKPENLFITKRRDGTDLLKILDFGIAKLRGSCADGTLTKTGAALGTPYYMAPEQARGQRDIDQRVDLYALGVILYEALSNHVPHPGDSYNAIMGHILTEAVTPLDELRPGLPDGLPAVVHRALAADRNDRHPDVIALAHALAKFVPRLKSTRPPSNRPRDAFAATVPADDRTGVVSGERPVAGITGVEDSGARPDSATAPTAQSVTEAGPASEPSSSTEADLLAAGLRPTATQQSRRNMLLTAVVSAVIAIVAVVVLDQLRDDDSPQVTSATASAQSPIIVSATVNEVIATSAPPGSPPSTSVPPFREPSTTGPPAVAKDAATGAATSKLAPVEIDRSDPYGQ